MHQLLRSFAQTVRGTSRIALLLLLALSLHCFPTIAAYAEQGSVTFSVYSPESIEDAYGILLEAPLIEMTDPAKTSDADVQALIQPSSKKRTARVQEISEDRYQIAVMLEATDRGRVLAYAQTRSGHILLTEVKLIGKTSEAKLETAKCVIDQNTDSVEKLLSLDQETLELLTEIRSTKEALLRKHLTQILTQETIAKLHQLESELGIAKPVPFRADLPLDELARRIGEISARQAK